MESSSTLSPFKEGCLKGKVALLTSGGSGIGYEISLQLGKHSASLAIMGQRDHVLHPDSTFEHYGRLDILVNAAAGIFLAVADHLSPNGFQTVIDIDAVGSFMMCRKALEYLTKGGTGKEPSWDGIIINVSATLQYTATWYEIHVSASKAVVDSVTRSLALEWGTDYGIRERDCTGPINDTTGASKLGPDELMTEMQQMPLFKLGDKWDITMAAVYLASDAGKFINGNKLVVDCGQCLSSPRHLAKDAMRQLSREAERRPRDSPVVLPRTNL